jgi:hypothetical protein
VVGIHRTKTLWGTKSSVLPRGADFLGRGPSFGTRRLRLALAIPR